MVRPSCSIGTRLSYNNLCSLARDRNLELTHAMYRSAVHVVEGVKLNPSPKLFVNATIRHAKGTGKGAICSVEK